MGTESSMPCVYLCVCVCVISDHTGIGCLLISCERSQLMTSSLMVLARELHPWMTTCESLDQNKENHLSVSLQSKPLWLNETSDWLSDGLTGEQTGAITDSLIEWLTPRLIDWLNHRLTDWLAYRLPELQVTFTPCRKFFTFRSLS